MIKQMPNKRSMWTFAANAKTLSELITMETFVMVAIAFT